MNLYLDDVRNMPAGFDTIARNMNEARAALLTGKVQKCSLDHDLGACEACMKLYGTKDAADWIIRSNGTSMPNCPHVGTGKDLVLWMITNNVWPAEKPTVHSANPVGSKIMRELIDEHFPSKVK